MPSSRDTTGVMNDHAALPTKYNDTDALYSMYVLCHCLSICVCQCCKCTVTALCAFRWSHFVVFCLRCSKACRGTKHAGNTPDIWNALVHQRENEFLPNNLFTQSRRLAVFVDLSTAAAKENGHGCGSCITEKTPRQTTQPYPYAHEVNTPHAASSSLESCCNALIECGGTSANDQHLTSALEPFPRASPDMRCDMPSTAGVRLGPVGVTSSHHIPRNIQHISQHTAEQQQRDGLSRPSALSAFSWPQHDNQRPRVVKYSPPPAPHTGTNQRTSELEHKHGFARTGSGESSTWDRDLLSLPAQWVPCEHGRRVFAAEGLEDGAGYGRAGLGSPWSGSDGSVSETSSPSTLHAPRRAVHAHTYLSSHSGQVLSDSAKVIPCRLGDEYHYHQQMKGADGSYGYSPTTVVGGQFSPEHWMRGDGVGSRRGGRGQWQPHVASRATNTCTLMDSPLAQSRFEFCEW